MIFYYMTMSTAIYVSCQFVSHYNTILNIIYQILRDMKDIGYEIQTKEQIEKLIKPNKSLYVELTTDTNVALDISGISLGGGESPVRFKLALKRLKRIM